MTTSLTNKTSSLWLNITCRIWALWALVFLAATTLPAMTFYLPCFFLDDPAKAKWHRAVSRVWMFVFMTLIGCRLRIFGRNNYVMATNYVVVCNHNSLMDVPASTPFLPRANKTIAKKSFSRIPVFGWIYSFGSVLVDRNSNSSRRKSFERMKKVLAAGLDMVIYPEGTRNRTGQPLKTFYDGAFRLAIDSKKPILPVVLFHTREILPANKPFYLRPHPIEMHFLPAIQPEGHSAEGLKTLVFEQMWSYYARHEAQ